MDDPTTYLYRDPSLPVIVVAGSLSLADEFLKAYGVSVQIGGPIHVVMTQSDAMAAIAGLPPTTPWCIIADGLTDSTVQGLIRSNFGPVQPIYKALGVSNKGIAWRFER